MNRRASGSSGWGGRKGLLGLGFARLRSEGFGNWDGEERVQNFRFFAGDWAVYIDSILSFSEF